MIESGLEAIIIKVAGIGLAEKHLGKTLAEMQPTLRRLVCIRLLFRAFELLTRYIESTIRRAHLRGRWGVRDFDSGLSSLQAEN